MIRLLCYNPRMITPKELEHIANLARIRIADDEKQSFLKDFDSILNYIDQLKKLPVLLENDNRMTMTKNVTRADTVKNTTPEDREMLLSEAPDRVGDFVAVKQIFGE